MRTITIKFTIHHPGFFNTPANYFLRMVRQLGLYGLAFSADVVEDSNPDAPIDNSYLEGL